MMKILINCAQCMREGISLAVPHAFKCVEDSGGYETVCPKGHKTFCILQQQQFEILFEIGNYAIIDEYYREAISSFTSSLERFYEFFIRICLIKRKISGENIASAWKKVKSQSERQLGAFIFLYLQEFGQVPALPSVAMTELRNEVIHKGKIPTREEALTYGQSVANIMLPLLKELKQSYQQEINQILLEHMKEAGQKKSDQNIPHVTVCQFTMISVAARDVDIEKYIEELRRQKDGLKKLNEAFSEMRSQ